MQNFVLEQLRNCDLKFYQDSPNYTTESYVFFVVVVVTATATAKSLQSFTTLCNRTDGSPPGSPVPGILQGRILEWVAISFSNS